MTDQRPVFRDSNLIRRPRGVFVTRLMNSDGGNYSRWRGVVSNRVSGGSNYPARFLKERDGGASVEEEGEREWKKGIELSRKFQEKSGLGVDTGKESMVQYAHEGRIRCLVRVTA